MPGAVSEQRSANEVPLRDQPEHQIDRVGCNEAVYPAQRFKTNVPELLTDRGEVYNICITRGTLTPEERFKIEAHIIMTSKMLQRLPLPGNMKGIPESYGQQYLKPEQLDGHNAAQQ